MSFECFSNAWIIYAKLSIMNSLRNTLWIIKKEWWFEKFREEIAQLAVHWWDAPPPPPTPTPPTPTPTPTRHWVSQEKFNILHQNILKWASVKTYSEPSQHFEHTQWYGPLCHGTGIVVWLYHVFEAKFVDRYTHRMMYFDWRVSPFCERSNLTWPSDHGNPSQNIDDTCLCRAKVAKPRHPRHYLSVLQVI